MKSTLQSSKKIKVRVIEYEPADILAFVQDPTKLQEVTVAVNADRRQKVALVDFRSDFSERIIGLGYSRLMKQDTKKDGTAIEVPDETEGEHIDRFFDSLIAGNFTPNDFTFNGAVDEKAKTEAVMAYMQTLAFKCGDATDADGNPAYKLDISRPEPKAKATKVDQWALDGAKKIIDNKNTKHWHDILTKGFTSPDGIQIDPVGFEPFHGKDAKELAPEVVHKNLARALVAYKKQETRKKQLANQGEFA
jgi:hypothetical protein